MFSRVKKSDFHKEMRAIRDFYQSLFELISARLDNWARKHQQLREEFNVLRDELATNGVVRDLRRAEKRIHVLETAIEAHHQFMHGEFDKLNHNGVADAINELNKEVFGQKKEGKYSLFIQMVGAEPMDEPTLAGKVDAIIEHLGIDLSVKPEEIIEAKVQATKKKPATKKRRRY